MVHVEETVTNRRLAGFLIRNTEHAQRVLHTLRAAPLPTTGQAPAERQQRRDGQSGQGQGQRGGQKPNGQEGKPAAWQTKSRVRMAA
jgi:translation initiation factor 3 subunit L